jgi:hypothetical protein
VIQVAKRVQVLLRQTVYPVKAINSWRKALVNSVMGLVLLAQIRKSVIPALIISTSLIFFALINVLLLIMAQLLTLLVNGAPSIVCNALIHSVSIVKMIIFCMKASVFPYALNFMPGSV